MIGLRIVGKSYDFSNHEISNTYKTGTVIGTELKSLRIWINSSSYPQDVMCDIMICREENTNDTISIPAFLIYKLVDHETINESVVVKGVPFEFISPDRMGDFHTYNISKIEGCIIGKYSCPNVVWGNDPRSHVLVRNFFIMCYPKKGDTIDYDTVVFFDERGIEKNSDNIESISTESNTRTAIPPIIIKGIDGSDGKDGIDGKDGADGADGRDGIDGVDGRDGADGRDGSVGDVPGFYVSATPPEGSGTSTILNGSMWYNTTNTRTYVYVHSTNFYWLLISDTSK